MIRDGLAGKVGRFVAGPGRMEDNMKPGASDRKGLGGKGPQWKEGDLEESME